LRPPFGSHLCSSDFTGCERGHTCTNHNATLFGLKHIGMAIIDEIRDRIARGLFEFSQHAVDQSISRRIRLQELREAIAVGEVVEDYPDDKYGPSCLVFGATLMNRPLHIQCSYPSLSTMKIITLYEPDPERWVDFKVRRRLHDR